MGRAPRGLRGAPWIQQVFQSRQATSGGVVRRKIDSVNHFASHALLEAEVRRRGFHMVVTADQYLIFCHQGHFQFIC
ncbi:N-(5'-phosphoribosyl)anthranilate isomerase [Mesorhizobium japonicum]|uniref:N-(5'-phosphoribosyl)anthranilate isomerase n=1 Tax=Mesorhizobium japonicum TaxID=2066070 RepID=UPI0012FEB949|nr:N-(5'-phosphoribosyl)anthranilate isomerase [Mesorhizobium japonicum]